ncbi:MAG: D-cysteine desulfhydrase family protein [Anaerolineae bacterium]|nr:D-cysteine desulfhydrase family protein [Anaerolineae bacterium]
MPLPDLPRFSLAHLPTPLEEMPRLRAALQIEPGRHAVPHLFVKRDDQTGLATGGNKTRKLELLVAEALRLGADTLVTTGAPQSNHCRQTAAAAARAGLACTLVLGGNAPMLDGGNLLLDRLFGAEIIFAGSEDRLVVMQRAVDDLAASGRRPFAITYGGSSPLGAAAYALAMDELLGQCAERGIRLDHVIVGSSSGGTQAGMVVGARALAAPVQIHGISIDLAEKTLVSNLVTLGQQTADLLGLDLTLADRDFTVHDAYLGGGYGVMGAAEREAIGLLARSEGLLADPVYTGRALAGLLDLIRTGRFAADETVVFWHTGGLPAIFAYEDALRG